MIIPPIKLQVSVVPPLVKMSNTHLIADSPTAVAEIAPPIGRYQVVGNAYPIHCFCVNQDLWGHRSIQSARIEHSLQKMEGDQ